MISSSLRRLLLGALLAGAGSAATAAALPAAESLSPLPAGGWVGLADGAVRLYDAAGAVRAERRVRADSLDLRVAGDEALALIVESVSQDALLLRIDLARAEIAPVASWAATQTVSAACLYRDAAANLHAFVVGKNGVADHLVLRGAQFASVRQIAVAPDAEACRVDDAGHRLFVSDAGGLWAHRADPEGVAQREPVALRQPLGPLKKGGGPVAVLAAGVAVADAGAARILMMARAADGGWRVAHSLPAPAEAEALVAWRDSARDRLAARADDSLAWRRLSLPPLPPAPTTADALPVVRARVQTDEVPSYGDAADDPALWIHPTDPARSLVLGTDKRRGLGVYDLQGRERQFLPVGRINNVDLRQDVAWGGRRADIAVATERDANALVVLGVAPDGRVGELGRVPTGMTGIYGLCLHRPAASAALEVFVNEKSGRFLHLRLDEADGRIAATRLREFRTATQPEGCVADDRSGRLFVGEERRGVWTAGADAGTPPELQLVAPVDRWLRRDVEGMAIYHGADASYLVVSSQSNDSYVVFDAAPPFRRRGAFRIGMNLEAGIDGVSETDGLDIASVPLGPAFPQGLLVVQDGYKVLPAGRQNFKYVAWEDIAGALGLR